MSSGSSHNTLAAMVKEHAVKQQIRKELQEKRKNEAVVAAHGLSSAVVDHLNFRVSHAYNNQKKLDHESKKLEKHATNLLQSTEQWVAQIDAFNQALKEIGDVESWSKAIETDMTIVLNTLQEVHKGKTAGQASNDNARPAA